MSFYLAHPVMLAELAEPLEAELSKIVVVKCPFHPERKKRNPREEDLKLVAECDGVIALLLVPTFGTSIEIDVALHKMKKPVFVYMPLGNLVSPAMPNEIDGQILTHPFLRGAVICRTLDELKTKLVELNGANN